MNGQSKKILSIWYCECSQGQGHPPPNPVYICSHMGEPLSANIVYEWPLIIYVDVVKNENEKYEINFTYLC